MSDTATAESEVSTNELVALRMLATDSLNNVGTLVLKTRKDSGGVFASLSTFMIMQQEMLLNRFLDAKDLEDARQWLDINKATILDHLSKHHGFN